jgi:carbohydrate kinase (thermoresistant glucokinase family)
MKAGIPLDDADRWPWLSHLNRILKEEINAVIACSALKRSYRERLAQGIAHFAVVYLYGSLALISERMKNRRHRYMPTTLLASQFTALEPPADAIAIDVAATPEECVAAIAARLTAGTLPRSGD